MERAFQPVSRPRLGLELMQETKALGRGAPDMGWKAHATKEKSGVRGATRLDA
jgi:hypothetical protein